MLNINIPSPDERNNKYLLNAPKNRVSENTPVSDDILLKYFILKKRSQGRDIYRPQFKCGNRNYLHSEYVYMRFSLRINNGIIIELYDVPNCHDKYEIPCIDHNELNKLIKEDNKILSDWIDEIKSVIKEKVENPEVKGLIDSQKKYTSEFLSRVEKAYNLYKDISYERNELSKLREKCQDVNIKYFFSKFRHQIKGIEESENMYIPPSTDIDINEVKTFYQTSQQNQEISNQKLRKSRDLMQKIMMQIAEIEMKARINKQKSSTLIKEYNFLRNIKQRANRKIVDLQDQVAKIHREKQHMEFKIRNLKEEIKSRDNMIKKIKGEKKDNNKEIAEINALKVAERKMVEDKMKLRGQIIRMEEKEKYMEKKEKIMQEKLDKYEKEQSKTEEKLQKISSKLNQIDLKVEENKIKTQYVDSKPSSELQGLKDQMNRMMEDNKRGIDDIKKISERKPVDRFSGLKKTKKRKIGSKCKKNSHCYTNKCEDNLCKSRRKLAAARLENFVPSKKKPKKARKPRKKVNRKERVDDLILFDDEKPKKKKRGKKIKVKVKRKKAKKEDEGFIFNFSLRDWM